MSYSIFAKHDKTYCIYNINDSMSLNELKYSISNKIGIPVHCFYLVNSGKIIDTIDYIKSNPKIDEYNDNNIEKIEKDKTLFVYIHGFDNFLKKLYYFFYENGFEIMNISSKGVLNYAPPFMLNMKVKQRI